MAITLIQKGGKVKVKGEWETKSIEYLEEETVLKIPEEALPLAVLSYTATSPFAFGIVNIRKSAWNHFMWMHRPGILASQDWYYREIPLQNYLGFDKRLKFWHNPNWTTVDRFDITNRIQYWLNQPKWKTRYDVLALMGQALNQVWIQNPLVRICSDYGSILRESRVDINYNLKHPAPDQVDAWFTEHSDKYAVYGRYAGE
jgi:hypothetical protein